MSSFNLRQEIRRKLIHLSSIIYPLLYIFVNKNIIIIILLILFIIIILWDISRIINLFPENSFLHYTYSFLREKERVGKRFSGSFYFLLSSVIVVSLFPKNIAILSLLVLVVCDTIAALVGKKYGKHKILDKTLEGWISFNISGFILATIYMSILLNWNNYILIILLFSVFVSSIIELISDKIKVDDNLSISLTFAVLSSLMIHGGKLCI